MKNKKKKIIVAALGATALGAGVTVAAVAQACGTTNNTPAEGSNQTISLDAFRALSGTNTAPASGTSELVLYNALLAQVNTLDTAGTVTSISIEILNSSRTTTANDDGTTLTVMTGNITISSVGGAAATYSNSNGSLTVSGITFADNRVASVGTIGGLIEQNNATIAASTFRELNGATSEPTDPGQVVFYRALLEEIQRINTAVTEIRRITIANPNDVTTSNVNDELQVIVTMGDITIEVTEGGTNGRDFINSATVLTVEDVVVENAQVQTTGAITGLLQQTDAVIAGNAVRALNGISAAPATGTSALAFFTVLQTAVVGLEAGVTITRINVDTTMVASSGTGTTISVSVAQNAISVETTGGTTSNFFVNNAGILTFDNISVTDGIVTTVGAPTGLMTATMQDISEITFRNLNGVTVEPNANTGERVLYDAFLTAIQLLDTTGVTSIAITITGLPSSVTAPVSGTPITVTANSLSITATGGLGGTYTNAADLMVTGVTFEAGEISAVAVITGLAETDQSIIRRGFLALNGVTPTTVPTDPSALIFYNSFLATIRTIDGSDPADQVSGLSITITAASVMVTAVDSLTVASGGITIVATGGLARTYTNNADYVISVTVAGIEVSVADTATNSGVLASMEQSTALTAFRALNGETGPPTDQGSSEAALYTALVNEIVTQGNAGVVDLEITITDPANVTADVNGTSVTVATGSITIISASGGAITTYSNTNAALVLSGLTYDTSGVIDGVGTTVGLVNIFQISGQTAVRALNGAGTGNLPGAGTSLEVLYVALQAFIENAATGSVIELITISNPTQDATANFNGTILTVEMGASTIEITTTGGTALTYRATAENLTFTDVEYDSGTQIITNAGTVLGLIGT